MSDIMHTIRHSQAHLLAQSIQRFVDPHAQLGTWPAIENGFYYDIWFSQWIEFGEHDLKQLTKNMKQISKEPQTFLRYDCSIEEWYKINDLSMQSLKNELLDKFSQAGETSISYYLNVVPVAVLDNMKNVSDEYVKMYKNISTYFQDKDVIDSGQSIVFIDLCAWPHVNSTKEDIDVNGLKLNKIAWAYRQADESNQMMTRVYGLGFEDKETLQQHEKMMEEAKKRDHKVLWKQLDLFTFSNFVWPRYPLLLAKWNYN